MPRRLAAPPRLADDTIRLEPLTQGDVPDMLALTNDPDIIRFTRVPTDTDEPFVRGWIGRYQAGWEDGTRAGFSIRDCDGGFVGFAALVDLDLENREAELGYMVAPAARAGAVSRAAPSSSSRSGRSTRSRWSGWSCGSTSRTCRRHESPSARATGSTAC